MYVELTIHHPDQASQQFRLEAGKRVVFGRGLGAGIRLETDGISRAHFALLLTSTRLFVTDLESRHGTYLSDERLEPLVTRLVVPGSRIKAGGYSIAHARHDLDPKEIEWNEYLQARAQDIVPARYEIMGRVGRGALGRVWFARDREGEQGLVAIKVLRLELNQHEEARARFVREAKLLELVDSPHVVRYVGSGISTSDQPYLICELILGPSVNDRIVDQDRLSIPAALRIGADVARGLMALEALDIVHRDVKPQNILIDPSGPSKLTDLGVAKQDGAIDNFSTQKGIGLGTLSYLAPEQAEDATTADGRSDLYALGATLYHMIAGKPPLFADDSDTRTQIERVKYLDPVSLRKIRPDCPAVVADLVERLLARAPEDRPQPAERVAAELTAIRTNLYPDFGEDVPKTAPYPNL